MLEVLGPGLRTTIQDGGRPDASALGVPRSGAADPLALAAANILLGNAPDAAAVEMILLGPELAVLAPCVVALAGADFQAKVPEDGRRLRPGTTHLLRAGTTMMTVGIAATLGELRAADPVTRARVGALLTEIVALATPKRRR